ncbi:MAG: US12 family protein [Acidobacteriaceae bacterium]|nr:US12 family protein [Acidobacteriaceae bacterium]MBV8570149.1 US12 family protein [Acidobacteriaceae bacterium]
MYDNRQQASAWENLSGTTALSTQSAVMIKQTYLLFSLAVISAMAGGYIGATSETLARFFGNWIGWIVALLLLNLVPRMAIAVRHNHQLGVAALVFDGFISGIALSPLLYFANRLAPSLIFVALFITAFVFVGITLYVMSTKRTFSAPRGLMTGIFFSLIGAILLNSFLHIGVIGILIAVGIGALGVFTLVYATSFVLRSPDVDSPIPGALVLFAGVFNVFVATLNILLRVLGGSRD